MKRLEQILLLLGDGWLVIVIVALVVMSLLPGAMG